MTVPPPQHKSHPPHYQCLPLSLLMSSAHLKTCCWIPPQWQQHRCRCCCVGEGSSYAKCSQARAGAAASAGWDGGWLQTRVLTAPLRVNCVISDVCPPCACHWCSSLVHWSLVCAQLMMVHKVLMSNINFSVTIASLCGCQLKWFVSCYCHFCCIFCSFHLRSVQCSW